LNLIPIPIDIHICRASLNLDVIRGSYSGNMEQVFGSIDEAWRRGVENSAFYSLQVDEPLWTLSKYGCTDRPKTTCQPHECPHYSECPVAAFCVAGKVSVAPPLVDVET
jgi:hypothetical protein